MSVAKLTISGIIGEKGILANAPDDTQYFDSSQLRSFLAEPTTQEAETIELDIATRGGDVKQGLEMYDLLQQEKRKGKRVITRGSQYDSIGSVIFAAGDERESVRNAKPLIHNAWLSPADLEQDLELNTQSLEDMKKEFAYADAQIIGVYANTVPRENLSRLRELMDNSIELSDQQLIDLGFATKIVNGESKKALSLKPVAYCPINSLPNPSNEYADVIGFQGEKVLLIKRSANSDFEPNSWAFAGGRVEDGEQPIEAAIRELKEETDLNAKDVEFVETIENEDGSKSHYFRAEVEGRPMLEETEIAEARFFDADEIKDLNIIKRENARYNNLILKSIDMSIDKQTQEKASAFDGMLAAFKNFLNGSPKNVSMPLDGGGELIIDMEEGGDPIGKYAFTVNEAGERVPAEAGEYSSGGKTYFISEGGQVENFTEGEQANVMTEGDLEKAVAEAVSSAKAEGDHEKEKALEALRAEKDEEMQAFRAESQKALENLSNEFKAFKKDLGFVEGDSADVSEEAKMKAFKEEQEKLGKMTRSERRIYNLKADLAKQAN